MAARALPEEQRDSSRSCSQFLCPPHPACMAREGSSRELSLPWDGVSRQINVFMSKSRELITSAKSIWVNKLKLYLGNLK